MYVYTAILELIVSHVELCTHMHVAIYYILWQVLHLSTFQFNRESPAHIECRKPHIVLGEDDEVSGQNLINTKVLWNA